MHITPDKLLFELIINGISTNITDYVSNWEDIKIDYSRDDLKGVYIDISNSIEFIGSAYTMLDNLYSTYSFNANAVFIVSLRNDVLDPSLTLWTYNELKRVDLDFSTFKRTDYVISLNAKSNSLADLIKANKGTVYDIPVSELSPISLYYDRLECRNEYTGTIINDFTSDDIGTICTHNFFNPINILFTSNDENIEGYIDPYTDGKYITILQDNVYSFNVKLRIWVLNRDENDPSTMRIVIKRQSGSTYTELYAEDVRYIIDEHDFNAYFNNIELLKDDKIYIGFDITGFTGEEIYPVYCYYANEPTFVFSYNTRLLPVYIKTVSLYSILNKLLYNIAGSEYTATISTGLSNDIRLASAESVRAFSNAKFHTSFEQFYNSMRAVFGLDYDISGNTIAFKPREQLFKGTKSIELTDVTDLELSVNTSHIYSSLKIGYKKVDYNKVNGKDEFRFTNEFSSGVTVSTKKLELISDYRSDAWGIEFLVQSRGEDTTDDQSDNDAFLIDCATVGGKLVPNRAVTITGVISPTTMFNVIFSPRQCLLRNSSYLGVSSNLYKFASSEGLSNIAINGVYENSDVTISNKLFLPDLLELKVGEISALPAEKDGYVEFVYNGITYQGYIKEINHFIGKDQETTWTLFRKTII